MGVKCEVPAPGGGPGGGVRVQAHLGYVARPCVINSTIGEKEANKIEWDTTHRRTCAYLCVQRPWIDPSTETQGPHTVLRLTGSRTTAPAACTHMGAWFFPLEFIDLSIKPLSSLCAATLRTGTTARAWTSYLGSQL